MAVAAGRAGSCSTWVGIGHDLVRLGDVGVRPVGMDASAEMLERARSTDAGVPLVRADGTRLPFGDGSLDGCRGERILQHVEAPAVVVTEIARVLRPGAFVAVFEPDYATFQVDSDEPDDRSIPARLLRVRHPGIGADVAPMLEVAGFAIDDIVTESSRECSLDGRLPVDAVAVLHRAVDDGRFDAGHAARWISEQQHRSAWQPSAPSGTRSLSSPTAARDHHLHTGQDAPPS